jgi:hypothetical protein
LGRPKLGLFPFGELFFGQLAGGLERILVCEQVKEVLAGREIFIGDQDGTTKRMFVVSAWIKGTEVRCVSGTPGQDVLGGSQVRRSVIASSVPARMLPSGSITISPVAGEWAGWRYHGRAANRAISSDG